jgi:hypothetical protein
VLGWADERTLIIKRRWGERFDSFAFRVMLWKALGDRVEWIPSLLPWRATAAARITRLDRPPDFTIDPVTACEPLRFLVRHFVREELGQASSALHKADERLLEHGE